MVLLPMQGKEQAMTAWIVVLIIVLVLVILGLIVLFSLLPDIQRYRRIRSM